jgi:D-3-phosphoglycerate dehydrogenase
MSTKKILVAGRLAPEGLARLEAEGLQADAASEVDAAGLARLIPGYQGLIVAPTVGVPAEVIRAADVLEVIGRPGTRVDDIDLGEATARGIVVTEAPQSDRVSAAEVVLAILLACAHEIVSAHTALRSSETGRPAAPEHGVEIRGKTLGLIGLDDAGPLVAEAAQALGMRVIAWDRGEPAGPIEQHLPERTDDLTRVCREADFLSVHLAERPENAGLVGEAEFAVMKPGVRVISAFARGIVDEAAWASAIGTGAVAGSAVAAGGATGPARDPLAALEGVILVDRASSQTLDAEVRAAEMVADQVAAALRGGPVRNAVNLPAAIDDDAAELMPYVDLCAQLGSLVVQLADGPVESVAVRYGGSFAYYDTRILSLGVLQGALQQRVDGKVNLVNAQIIADAARLRITETSDPTATDFPRVVSVSARGAWGEVSVTGTSLGPEHKPRLVEVFGDAIDIGPAPRMLFLWYEDLPGVGGKLGTMLGEWGVNIGNMSVGRGAVEHHAVMALTLDQPLTDEQLGELVAHCGLDVGKSVEL